MSRAPSFCGAPKCVVIALNDPSVHNLTTNRTLNFSGASHLAEPAGPRARNGSKMPGIDEIYRRMLTAIVENRLRPGMQLVEERLASIFGVSRTKIREATSRLVHEGVAINLPNRGAFVATPTAAQARQLLAARRLIEPEVARLLARNASRKQVAALRSHVKREVAARAGADPHAIVPLSGEFHLLMADMAGNMYFARMLRELEVLTCLVIILYDSPNSEGCQYDDHVHIVDAIEARDPEKAAALMLHHIDNIEASLDLSPPDTEIQLEDAFK
jgi:DNA-binding GntR family transcriptional regulator